MMKPSLVPWLAAFVSAQSWNRPNSLFTNTTNATAYGCEAACQKLLDQYTLVDRTSSFAKIPFDTGFYATSPSFSPSRSQPGDVLKLEPYINSTTAWRIPSGTTLYRLQYVTLDPHDRPVPATGFIAFPWSTAAEAPDHRYRWISYARGTFGTHYGCAPSSAFNLYDYDTIRPLLLEGYAVVATDYQGTGNNYTLHPYLDSKSNGVDVIFAAVAAKKAFPLLLGDEWAASGHSQGGGAVWGLVESDYLRDCQKFLGNLTLRFVGGVALEPGMRVYDELNSAPANTGQGGSSSSSSSSGGSASGPAYTANFVQLLNAYDPSAIPKIFTSKFLDLIALSNEIQTCEYADEAIGAILAINETIQPEAYGASGILNSTFLRYQKERSAGVGAAAKAPMLVIQSTADTTVPYSMVAKAYKATCSAGGEPVELSEYSILGHAPMVAASAPEWLGWIRERFASSPRVTACTIKKRQPLNAADAFLSINV